MLVTMGIWQTFQTVLPGLAVASWVMKLPTPHTKNNLIAKIECYSLGT